VSAFPTSGKGQREGRATVSKAVNDLTISSTLATGLLISIRNPLEPINAGAR
jgi:hypothetical protein